MNNTKLSLVLMAGLPGAGKTTLACVLGSILHWQVINKDKLKEDLLKQGKGEEEAGIIAYEQSFNTALNALTKQHTSVILDSAALQNFILENALDIVHNVPNVQLKVIFCVASRDLRNQRVRTRPFQITNIRVDPITIAEYFKFFQHLPSDRLTLFTIEPLEKCLAEAGAYLLNQSCLKI